jgi:hypothetical protein
MGIGAIIELLTDAMGRGPKDHIFQLVSSNGDGTGTVDLNQSSAADYYVRPGLKEKYVLRRMNVWEVDQAFTTATNYGAGSALTNGIGITVENGNEIIKNYTPVTIKTTFEWGLLAGVDSSPLFGAGEDAHLVRWTFNKGGGNIVLDGSKGEFLKVSYGDAMNFMTSIRIQVQGYKKSVKG